MTVSRRQFLGLLAGAVAAPAIVRAENLMKIWVPKNYLVFNIEPSMILPHQDYNLSFWMKDDRTPDWHKVHRKFMWNEVKDGQIKIDLNSVRMNNPMVHSNYPLAFSSFQLESGRSL